MRSPTAWRQRPSRQVDQSPARPTRSRRFSCCNRLTAMSLRAIPVLLYHAVPDTATADDPLSVPYEQFASHVDAIVGSRRTPVSVAEIASGLRGERTLSERAVAVTFDDAYADTPRAVELLREHGLRASVYVTTGQIGSGPMIRREQLERLARQPETVELGA